MKIAIWSLVIAALLPAPTNPTTAVSIVTTGFQAGQAIRDCSNCPEIVIVPAGSFTMGSPASEPERDDIEGPQRQVSVRQFAVGKFDVTRRQWAAFVRATTRRTAGGCAWAGPSNEKLDPRLSWQKLGFVQDDSHPVVCVTWQDAQDYSHWLSTQTGHQYRLLSEAEWEYAARGGTTTAYPWGSSASHDHANYGADECCRGLASGRDQWERTSPVGSFPPNWELSQRRRGFSRRQDSRLAFPINATAACRDL